MLSMSQGIPFKVVSRLSSRREVLCCHFSSDGKLLASSGHEKKRELGRVSKQLTLLIETFTTTFHKLDLVVVYGISFLYIILLSMSQGIPFKVVSRPHSSRREVLCCCHFSEDGKCISLLSVREKALYLDGRYIDAFNFVSTGEGHSHIICTYWCDSRALADSPR